MSSVIGQPTLDDIREAVTHGVAVPGVTYRACADIVRRYFQTGPKNKIVELTKAEYDPVEAAALADPYDLSLPRAWSSTYHVNRDWFLCAEAWEQDENSPEDCLHYVKKFRNTHTHTKHRLYAYAHSL